MLPVLLFAVAFSIPHEESIGRAIVESVVPDAPADAAGFQNGDVIYEVGGRDAKNFAEASRLIRLNLGMDMHVLGPRGQGFVTLPGEPGRRRGQGAEAGGDRAAGLTAVGRARLAKGLSPSQLFWLRVNLCPRSADRGPATTRRDGASLRSTNRGSGPAMPMPPG